MGSALQEKLRMLCSYIKKTRQWNSVPDLVTHNTIMKGFYKVKDFEKAPEIWDCIYKMVYYQISSPIILPLRVFVLTTESGAIGFLDEAVDRGVLPTAITWNIHVREIQSPIIFTLKGLCSCYRISDAIGFLDEAVDHWVLPTAITWSMLVRAVLDNRALT
ncbi:hypothetical protein CK203_117038 [Vitis vinifera]|uniref:Pentatricopeptide repeat-containing protein n=1 Tax=Vitis vinifera TaxID=29760 RepID=A0A438E9V0_VITVI|nr:hypothetical protein CK203_117038 [Vitis vinifera]